MEIKKTEDGLQITTRTYQAISGAIVVEWGHGVIILDESDANLIADGFRPHLDEKAYNNYYNVIRLNNRPKRT